MRVAVQMDPIETINIEADSTFALMAEAQSRGHLLWHYQVQQLSLQEGVERDGVRHERLTAQARPISVQRVQGNHADSGRPSVWMWAGWMWC